MVETVCSHLFSSSRKLDAFIGVFFQKCSNFGLRERKYFNTWGGDGRVRGQKSHQTRYDCTPFVFITI